MSADTQSKAPDAYTVLQAVAASDGHGRISLEFLTYARDYYASGARWESAAEGTPYTAQQVRDAYRKVMDDGARLFAPKAAQ